MKRTTITMDKYGRVTVPSDAASVWMSEMELVKLFDVIAPTLMPPYEPCTRAECCPLMRWKNVPRCPTDIIWKLIPSLWSWHLLSELIHRVRQVYAMPF